MKSKTLAFATLLLVTAFLLVQAIAPHTALADSTWTDSRGPGNGDTFALAYDSAHNLLYAGTGGQGPWYYSVPAPIPPPTISSITPSSGTVGTTVHITNLAGTNFLTGATVKLSKSGQGDMAATGVTVESDTEITCDFDLTGAATGAWDVVVTNPDTQYGTLISGFTVTYPAPTVSSITPSSGVNNGSVSVTNLAGTNFLAGAALKLTDQVFAMDGTPDIKDAVHNLKATLKGTPSFASLLGVQAPIITAGTTNYLSAVNSGFETGVGDWTTTGGQSSLSSSTDWADTGTHSLKITPITGATAALFIQSVTDQNKPYEVSCKFKGTVGKTYQLVAWDDVAGYDNYSLPVVANGTTQSLTIEVLFGTCTQRRIFFWDGASAPADVAYIDTVKVVDAPPQVSWPTASLGITPGMPVSIVCVVNKTGAWNDGLHHMMFKTSDSGMTNGFEVLGSGVYGMIAVVNWCDGASRSTGVPIDSTNWAPNVNHIIVATIDEDNNQRIFVDGVEGFWTSGSCARETALGTDVVIGTHGNESFNLPLDGSILVAVYGRVLDDVEIARISAATSWNNDIVNPDTINATNVNVVSSTKITGAFDLTGKTAGNWNAVVTNTDGQTGSLVNGFQIQNATPTTTSISPKNKTAGDAGFNLTVNGTSFVNGSIVRWNGNDRTTTFVSGSQLSAAITATDISTVGTASVTVFNPGPGGGTSNPQIFMINASSFYFAEGYTGTNFQEYLCLGNPNTAAATANVTYLFSDGTTKNANYSVPATGRTTVNVNSEVGPDKEVSIQVLSDTANLVAERPMYFNYNGVWTGGSDAVGATAPNASWYFAEGNTLSGFDQYVTVLNPGDATANLTFHYMVEGQGEKDVKGSVGPHSRATFNTRDQIGANLNASLYLSSNQAVVAERPMYFNYLGLAANNWTGGHDVVGTNSPQKQWYLAEGTTREGFEEWLCLENPGSSDITVNATYQLGSGQGDPINKSYTVPAKQRLTVSVNREIGPEKDDSVFLSSTSDFIAERPMYFNYHNVWTGGHDVLGANNSAKTWYFAEGTTRDNFDEWLCLQNPGNADAHVNITYYTTSGQANNKPWTVSANSRLTINVNQDAGANQDISAKVSSDKPIIVERPMYFDYNGWTGGHDVVGFAPTPAPTP